MTTKAWGAAACVAVLVMSGACRGREREQGRGAAAAPDTARLRSVYGQIDSAYDSLVASYGAMAAQLSPEERQLFESVQGMHAQAKGAHGMMMGGAATMGGGGMMRGGGMMGGGSPAGGGALAREWDEQMQGMHQAMSALLQQSGDEAMARVHQRMAQLYGQALEYLPRSTAPAPGGEPSEEETSVSGSGIFAQSCAPCHGSDGRGVAGIFPPLATSEWLEADPDTPVRIVLHGLQGPVDVQGRSFDGVMPAFGARLTDRQLAAVLSYARSAFGNGASAVDPSAVGAVRRADAGRTRAMSADELR